MALRCALVLKISCSPKRLTRRATGLHRDIPVCRITVGSQRISESTAAPSGAEPSMRSAALASCNPLTTATYTASGLLNLS